MRLRPSAGRAIAILLAVALTLGWAAATPAVELPATGIAYEIEVTLDPATRILDAHETIRWTNPSSAPVERIPLHLYLNGFANEDSSWMREVPSQFLDIDELLELYDDPWGWIEPGTIRQGTTDLAWTPIAPDDGNPSDRSLIEVTLARPLEPGESVELVIDFRARLPVPIARTGGRDDFFFVAQWFPKVAVFETIGVRGATEDRWAAHQFHGPTEFYADYADYDVRMGVPRGWAVGATGRAVDFDAPAGSDLAWFRFRQRAVHDFAWATGEQMVDIVSTHRPQGSGGPVELHYFLPRGTEHQVALWEEVTRGGLDVLGSRIGPYPYETLTVVFGPSWASPTFGMEYPTLFTADAGDPLNDSRLIPLATFNRGTIAHELAHQYFHGVVGSNEFDEAYMDEGLTEFWGYEILIDTFGNENVLEFLGRGLSVTEFEQARLIGETLPQPVWSGPSYVTLDISRFSQFYGVPAVTMRTAAALHGKATVDRVFAAYYERWAFRHPRFEDFQDVVREVGGAGFAELLLEAFTQHRLPDYRVTSLESESWERARGRLVTAEGVIEADAPDADEIALAGLDPAAFEVEGLMVVEILDPGWTRPHGRQPGAIERIEVRPRAGEPDDDWEAEENEFHLSTVRLDGSGWDHVPVEVHFRFADGAVWRETWDGRAGYRRYRFLRAAPLSEVRVDPERRIALDPDRQNNAMTRESDDELLSDWSGWTGALGQLLFEALGQWL